MRAYHLLSAISCTLLVSSCALYESNHVATTTLHQPTPLVIPAGKHWQIMEEPPTLSNDLGVLPFQMEQSLQPEGAPAVTPLLQQRSDTPHK